MLSPEQKIHIVDEIDNWYGLSETSAILSEIIYKYSCFVLSSDDNCGKDTEVLTELHVLKLLKDTFETKKAA